MEYANLGQTQLSVSRIAFGCEQLGGVDWGKIDDKEASAAVGRALDLGINFFDTSDVYGLGRSEELLAIALGPRRHEVVIASKFGVNWQPVPRGGRAKTFLDASPKRVVEALEGSLRRLKLDSIPLYQVAWPDPNVPVSDTMEALGNCQDQGKIQHIGYSNATTAMLSEALQIHRVEALQVSYNLGDRGIEQETLPFCAGQGIGVLVYGSLAQGLLTGKYDKNTTFGADDRRHRLRHFQGPERLRYLRVSKRVEEVALKYEKSPAQVAIRWILDNSMITSAIVGIKTPAQAVENAGASGWKLSADDIVYLQEAKLQDLEGKPRVVKIFVGFPEHKLQRGAGPSQQTPR